jgi:hypothetical protein
MKHQRHFESMTPRLRQVATVLGMIDDLDQVARLLDCESAAQELNQQKTALPLLASLTSRRGESCGKLSPCSKRAWPIFAVSKTKRQGF